MTIQISAQNVEELRDKVFAIALAFGFESTPKESVQIASKPLAPEVKLVAEAPPKVTAEDEEVAPKTSVPVAAKAAPKKEAAPVKGKKSKAVEASDEPSGPVEDEGSGPNKDDVESALKRVSSAHGIPAARKVLIEFEASRISELKIEQYADFIKACAKAAKA